MKRYKKDLLNSVIDFKYDQELFLAMAQDLIKELELTEYVKDVSLENISKERVKGTYDGTTVEIATNKEEKFTLFYYRDLFDTLFHELEHAKQDKLIVKYNEYYCKLPDDYCYTLDERKELARIHAIGVSGKIMSAHKNLYKFKHDLFPSEHEANYYGFFNSTDFLLKILPEFKRSLSSPRWYNYKIMQLLLKGYKVKLLTSKLSSPVERILTRDINTSVKNVLLGDNDLNNYERMILGLPVDKDVFLKIYNDTVNDKVPIDVKDYVLKI